MSSEINYKFYKNGKDIGEITLSKEGFYIENGLPKKITNQDVIKLTKTKKPTHFSINNCNPLKFNKDIFYLYLPKKRTRNKKTFDNVSYLLFAEPLRIQLKPVKCK